MTSRSLLCLLFASFAVSLVACDDGGSSRPSDTGLADSDAVLDDTSIPDSGEDASPGDVSADAAGDADGDTAIDDTVIDAPTDGDAVDGDVDGPPVPVNQQAASGTRLKAVWAVADDGQRAFRGWYDVQADVPCAFKLAVDGELRCLPTGLEQGYNLYRGYRADTCQGAAFMVDGRDAASAACNPAPYFVSRDASVCPDTRYRVEAVGAASAQSTYFYAEGGTCSESSAVGSTLVALSDRPATDWVRGTLAYEGGDDAITAAIVEADDGARGWYGLAIPSLGHAECRLDRAADGASRCLPAWRAYSPGIVWEDLFADDSCTVYVAQMTQWDMCMTRYGLRYDDRGSCAPRLSVHEIGSTFDTMMYRGSPGACTEQGQNGGPGYHTTGPEIPAENFAAYVASETPPAGEGRLVRLPYAIGALELGSGAYYDSTLGASCSFLPTAGGDLRCMPGSFAAAVYEDDACTQLVVLTERSQCSTPPFDHVLVAEMTGCASTYRSFELGESVVPTTLYVRQGEACVERSPHAGELAWARVGVELAPDSLVRGELVTDP